MDVQTAEGVWHEGIVEPVQLVRGDVEVLQVHLGSEQPVEVLHLIVRQVQVGQVGQGSKAALVERLQPVLGDVEEVQAWCLVEGGRVNLGDVVAQVEEGELLQPLDVLPPDGANYVDAGFKSGSKWADCAECREGHQSSAGPHPQPAVRPVDEGDCRGKLERSRNAD